MVDREPGAGAPEAGHDLVGDEQDAVLVAQRPEALHVAVGRDEDAVGAHDGLDHDGRDGLRTLEHHDLLEVAQALLHRLRVLAPPAVEVGDAHDARDARLRRPAARIAGGHHDLARRAVIRAVAGHDLLAAGELARELDGVLVRLGAAVGEEEDVDVAGADLRQLGAQPGAWLGGHERIRVGQSLHLGVDGIVTRRSPWPMFTDISWLLKSR